MLAFCFTSCEIELLLLSMAVFSSLMQMLHADVRNKFLTFTRRSSNTRASTVFSSLHAKKMHPNARFNSIRAFGCIVNAFFNYSSDSASSAVSSKPSSKSSSISVSSKSSSSSSTRFSSALRASIAACASASALMRASSSS